MLAGASIVLWLLKWATPTGFIRNLVEWRIKSGAIGAARVETARRCRRLFNDVYSLILLAMATLTFCLSTSRSSSSELALVLVMWRIAEIALSQLSVLLQTDTNVSKERRPRSGDARRWLLVALFQYSEVVIWFAFLYMTSTAAFSNTNESVPITSRVGALYFSLVTMVTLGYGDIHPITTTGAALVLVQLPVALLLTVMTFARFVGALSPVVAPAQTADHLKGGTELAGGSANAEH